MKTNLTTDGIMMREGSVLATNVSVDYVLKDQYGNSDNTVYISYRDREGINQYYIRKVDGDNLSIIDEDSEGCIKSLLSYDGNWYLFW